MTSIGDLYRRTILEHSRHPRNLRVLKGEVFTAERRNVTCGDRIVIAVDLNGDVIRDIAFQGAGCAISVAAASVMTEAVMGRSRADALLLLERFTALVKDGGEGLPTGALGDLDAFRGVARFPVRIGCATLAWLALAEALSGAR